jgi:hypothetical protein
MPRIRVEANIRPVIGSEIEERSAGWKQLDLTIRSRREVGACVNRYRVQSAE